jgi:purine-binding chemotaxis protein CheW
MEDSNVNEIILFNIGDLACGLDIRAILEIKRLENITTVYGAPSTVEGVINLRGEIVTVLNLGELLHGESHKRDGNERVMVVASGKEKVGLLVNFVDDVISFTEDFILPIPPNLDKSISKYINSVYQWENNIISLINLEAIIVVDSETESFSTGG